MKICPCCKLPTLPSMDLHVICPVCLWQNDYQNESNKDEIFGGPNRDYSLSEAQSNFKKYYISFRPSDKRFKKLNKNISIKKELLKLNKKIKIIKDETEKESLKNKYSNLLKKISYNK